MLLRGPVRGLGNGTIGFSNTDVTGDPDQRSSRWSSEKICLSVSIENRRRNWRRQAYTAFLKRFSIKEGDK